MQKILLTLCAVMMAGAAVAQDTLFTRDGRVIPAKVHEITQTEIKYKKPTNPDGPLYVVSKDEIAVIEYKNGSKDVFQMDGSVADNSASGNSAPQVNNNYYNANPQPNVSVVLGMGGYFGVPYWNWGWYRPWRPYRSHYWGGYYWGGNWGWHHGHHYHHRRH